MKKSGIDFDDAISESPDFIKPKTTGAEAGGVIQPKKYNLDTVCKTFIWADPFEFSTMKDALCKTVLKAGDYPIAVEKRYDNVSDMMGYIDASDIVIIVIGSLYGDCTVNVSCKNCNDDDCRKNKADERCLISMMEFVYRYSTAQGKKVLIFYTDEEDKFTFVGRMGNKGKSNDELEKIFDSGKAAIQQLKDEIYNKIKISFEPNQNETQFQMYTLVRNGYISEAKGRRKEIGLCSSEKLGKDKLLCAMSDCIQKNFKPTTIGHYTVDSGEMIRTKAGDEIHIITNEMYNYDFTPMSSLTIAINTEKGVHYYYYLTEDQKETFQIFEERLKGFYRKTFRARQDVVSWIRQAKSRMYDYTRFLQNIVDQSVRTTITSLLTESGVEEDPAQLVDAICAEDCNKRKILSDTSSIFQNINIPKLLQWIAGKSFPDESGIYNAIDMLCIFLRAFPADKHYRNYSKIKAFCDKLELLRDMKLLTVWQTRSEGGPTKIEEIHSLLERFRKDESKGAGGKEILSEPIKDWMMPVGKRNQSDKKSNEIDELVQVGEDPNMTEEAMEHYLGNVHYCPIVDGQPYTLCYSFSLFLCGEGADAAWYSTCVNSNNKRIEIDNDLIMIEFMKDQSTYNSIIECYRQIILSNPEILKELKKYNSRIFTGWKVE